MKFELNLILQFISYAVIMPRNIFLDHSPPFYPHMRFFISPLVLTRFNRMVWLSARTVVWLKPPTFLLYQKVPQRFWGNVTLAACYLINRMPSSVLHDQVPQSIIFSNQPLFCFLPRAFGCVSFVHILTLGQDKLSAKAMKSVLLGYSRL